MIGPNLFVAFGLRNVQAHSRLFEGFLARLGGGDDEIEQERDRREHGESEFSLLTFEHHLAAPAPRGEQHYGGHRFRYFLDESGVRFFLKELHRGVAQVTLS